VLVGLLEGQRQRGLHRQAVAGPVKGEGGARLWHR
jgi:hypothetical protein